MKSLFQLLLCILLFSLSCSQDKGIPQKPEFNLTSPDNSVKSFWTYIEWRNKCDQLQYKKLLNESPFFANNSKNTIQNNFSKELSKESYLKNNKIDKVDIQSPTRAIVWTLEVKYDKDDAPDSHKYILTKENDNWVFEDILSLCYRCKGTGQQDDLEEMKRNIKKYPYTAPPKIKCQNCNGKGWESFYYLR
jgi:hypothetical protein